MIRIGDFFTEPFPVTVALWNGVCGKTGALSLRPGDPDLPVTLVNRLDAAEFCNALSGLLGLEKAYDKDGHRVGPGLRLPSQEEWEGASAPQGHFLWGDAEYPNGENPYAVLYAGDGISGERESDGVLVHRCGTKLPNRFGLYDMCGNVCEWTDSRDGDGYCILCGGSVHLDCVFDAGSVERVPEIFRSRRPDSVCSRTRTFRFRKRSLTVRSMRSGLRNGREGTSSRSLIPPARGSGRSWNCTGGGMTLPQ